MVWARAGTHMVTAAYVVTGILAPSGSVLDRLILTDTASVWQVHEDYTASSDDSAEDRKVMEDERELTLALVRYKTPMAALSFPRYINTRTEMQAAAPALEITRLLNMLGIGTDVLRTFAGVLLLTAGLSVFIALWSAVRERSGDLALLRMLGAPPRQAWRRCCCARRCGWGVLACRAWACCWGRALPLAWAGCSSWTTRLLIGGMAWPS
jgi:putative ABC transport system permease protein